MDQNFGGTVDPEICISNQNSNGFYTGDHCVCVCVSILSKFDYLPDFFQNCIGLCSPFIYFCKAWLEYNKKGNYDLLPDKKIENNIKSSIPLGLP